MNWLSFNQTQNNPLNTKSLENKNFSSSDNIEKASNPNSKKKKYWTLDEDEKLGALAKEFDCDWKEISKYMPSRSIDQIIHRWTKRFDPCVKKNPWTPEEDNLLKATQEKFGNDWKQISKFLPGRLPNSIKNRYYGYINKKSAMTKPCIFYSEPFQKNFEPEEFLELSDKEIYSCKAPSNDQSLLECSKNKKSLLIKRKKNKIEKLYLQVAKLETLLSKTKESLKFPKWKD